MPVHKGEQRPTDAEASNANFHATLRRRTSQRIVRHSLSPASGRPCRLSPTCLALVSCANPTRDSRRDSIYVPYGGPRPCFCCSRSRVLLHVSRYDPLCMEGKFGRPEPITIFGKKSVFDLGLIWDIFLRSCHCCGLWDSPSTRTYDSGSKIPICKVPREGERVEWSGVAERLAHSAHPKPPIGWPVHGRGHRGEGTVHHRI